MKGRLKHISITAGCILFWLVLWQILAVKIDSRIILVSPVEVVKRLCVLVTDGGFWGSIAYTLLRILLGFALGLVSGCCLVYNSGADLGRLGEFVSAGVVSNKRSDCVLEYA